MSIAIFRRRGLPRATFLGEQGKLWLKDIGSAAIACVIFYALWWFIHHARAFERLHLFQALLRLLHLSD